MLGRSVGNYRLISKIGQGGMGVVYLAEHKTLGRRAAVKVLVPELSSNQDLVSRFFNEARAATAIRNPSIVEVFDFGFLDDRSAYIVMEYLDGESLAARISKARPKVQATLVILRAIARVLQAAHELGIVHRDLKPDNVFLVPDADLPSGERIKLLDFGIAKLNTVMGQTGHTRTGTVMGTPTYMAPEQCRGAGSVDHRADLYALGCIAYEMLCGQPPFVAEGAGEMIARHLYFEPAPPRALRAGLRPEVEELVLRLLQKDPADRPSTATEVSHVIERLVATAPTVAPRIESAEPAVAVRRRRSEPLGVPAIVDGPRNEVANRPGAAGRPRNEPEEPPIALRRRRDEPLASTIPAGRSRDEAPDPEIALERRDGQLLAPTVPAVRRRNDPMEPIAAERRRRSEPLDPPATGGRPRSEPLDPSVVERRRRSEPLDAVVASGRRHSQPLAAPVTSGRPSEPLDRPLELDRPRIAPADPPGAAGRRRTESVDPLVASYRRLSESLDRPVAPLRSGMMNTTLSGAVVSDVNTSAPTVLRSGFSRSRIAVGVGAAIVTLLVVATWTRLAARQRGSKETASVATPGPEPELAKPPTLSYGLGTVMATSAAGAGAANADHAAPQSGVGSPQPAQPVLVLSQSAPVAAPPTPVAAPGPASLPATRDSTAGDSRDPIERVAEPRSAEKPVDGATRGNGVSTEHDPPPPNRHHKTRAKTADTAKPGISDPSATLVDATSTTPLPVNATGHSSTTPGTSSPGEATVAPPKLSCAASEQDAAPGQLLRVLCELDNPNGSAISIRSVEVAVGTNAALQAVGQALPEIPPHDGIRFELTPTLPRSVVAGTSVPITITINATEFAPAQQQIMVAIR